MKILFLSHTFYGGVYRVGSHELFEIALAQGHKVLHVSTPISPFHYIRKFIFRREETLRFERNQLVKWSRIPFALIPLQFKLSKWLPGTALRTILKNDYDLVLIDQPYFLRFFDLLKIETRVILRLTDIISDKKQRNLIYKNLEKVYGIAVTNPLILTNLKLQKKNTIVLPNGLGVTISKMERDVESQHGMIYIGALDNRIDWRFIEKLSLSPGFEYLHLFGTGKLPNKLPDGVTFMGSLNFEKSASVMKKYKFLVLPYKDNESNKGRSPMKLDNAIKLGLIPLVPDWMRHHGQLINKYHILISEIMFTTRLPAEINSENQAASLITWEENFEKLLKWSLDITLDSKNEE